MLAFSDLAIHLDSREVCVPELLGLLVEKPLLRQVDVPSGWDGFRPLFTVLIPRFELARKRSLHLLFVKIPRFVVVTGLSFGLVRLVFGTWSSCVVNRGEHRHLVDLGVGPHVALVCFRASDLKGFHSGLSLQNRLPSVSQLVIVNRILPQPARPLQRGLRYPWQRGP